MAAIKVVIIGYGGMGSYHQKELMPQALVEVVGIYDIAQTAQDKAREAGLTVYESLEQVLKDASVEAVLIATPNDVHKSLSIAALRAGKQVICEKPVAMNVGELDEILAVAVETGNTFMVHQNRRWDPDFLVIRDLYQKGQIGDLFQIESRVHGANTFGKFIYSTCKSLLPDICFDLRNSPGFIKWCPGNNAGMVIILPDCFQPFSCIFCNCFICKSISSSHFTPNQ